MQGTGKQNTIAIWFYIYYKNINGYNEQKQSRNSQDFFHQDQDQDFIFVLEVR